MGQHLVCAARKNEPCRRLSNRRTPLPRLGDRGPSEGQRNAEAQGVDCVRIVHLAQNAIHHAPTLAIRRRIGAELRRIWNAATLDDAEAELRRLAAASAEAAPDLAAWLEANVPDGLAAFTLPEGHRKRLRTANPIERAVQQEIKRRTAKVGVFPSRDALLRLVSAVLAEIDDEWLATDRRYVTWGDRDA